MRSQVGRWLSRCPYGQGVRLHFDRCHSQVWQQDVDVPSRFRARLVQSCGPQSFTRLIQLSTDYAAAQAREAELRETRAVLDPETFRAVRRENSAIRLCLGVIEFSLGIDLPDEVFKDEQFMALYWAVVDMVDLANVSLVPLSGSVSTDTTFSRICTRTKGSTTWAPRTTITLLWSCMRTG